MTTIEELICRSFCAQWRKEREKTQMTLGGFIKALAALPEGSMIIGLKAECNSYRGYYEDLAFEPSNAPQPVSEVLACANAALYSYFRGYKDFHKDEYMDKSTPLWIATWGDSGVKLIGLHDPGDGSPIVCVTKHDL